MEFAPLIEPPSIEEVLLTVRGERIRLVGRAEGYAGLLDPLRCVPSDEGGMVDAVIAQDVLPAEEEAALELVLSMAEEIVPGGTLLVIEQSQQVGADGKGLLQRGLEALGFLHPPERLTRIFLRAGLLRISQMWPQGVRSLVITSGVKPPFHHPIR